MAITRFKTSTILNRTPKFIDFSGDAQQLPVAPAIGTATDVGTGRAYNNGAAVVTFTPTGTYATNFVGTSSPGSFTGSSATSPVTVTGLAAGTSYQFTVYGQNDTGSSAISSLSNSITATTVPQAPTIGSPSVASGQAYTGSANVSVAFTANATGGKSITGYTVTSSSGNTGTGASSPISVSDVVGTSRTYTVVATNANGSSASSSASASITPASVPQAPTIGTATAGDGSATVTFTDNATGGSAITGHTVTSSPGGLTGSGSSPVTVSGLSNGTAYTFTVTASNAQGTSAASAASNSVTPAAVGSFESISTVTLSSNNATITFSSIPSTYRHLQIRGVMYGSVNGSIAYMRVNGDSTSNYSSHKMYGGFTTTGSGGAGNELGTYMLSFGPTSIYGMQSGGYENVGVIDILNYSNTSAYKTAISKGGMVLPSASGDYSLSSGSWRSTAAISNVTLHCVGGLFVAGTTFALYGIKDV